MNRCFLCLVSLLVGPLIVSSAHAFKCYEGMMVQKNGNLVDNSSCENAYLAQVAGTYGFKVSPSALDNPNKKKDICRSVFTDIRVQMICERAGVPEYRR